MVWKQMPFPTLFFCHLKKNQTAASYQPFEATEEELVAAKRPPRARKAKKTAAKAAPAPASAKAASQVAEPKSAQLETPVKDGKRQAKLPEPEATPEVHAAPPNGKPLQKRQRGKQADPNPEAQVESLKEAPHHATPTWI